jgi:hypothetical protein
MDYATTPEKDPKKIHLDDDCDNIEHMEKEDETGKNHATLKRQSSIEFLKKRAPYQMSSFNQLQTTITLRTRQILMDWLLEVSNELKKSDNLFFAAAQLTDAFTCCVEEKKDYYQLLGMTCMMIVSKMYEIDPIDVDFCVYICDNFYSWDKFIKKERDVLRTFDFNIVCSNIHHLYTDLMELNSHLKWTVSCKRLSLFLLEASVIAGMHHHDDMDLVSACLYVACELFTFNHQLVTYYTNNLQRLHEIGQEILDNVKELKKRSLVAVFEKHKYDHNKFNLVLPNAQRTSAPQQQL